MHKIKKAIKDFLYSRYCPDIISEKYFQLKDATSLQQLNMLLAEKKDLMQAVEEIPRAHWNMRIDKVLKAPENKNIPRNKLAGKLIDGNLIMHNGIKINPLSYYSFPVLKMMMLNKGVHEPEEERVFQEVIKGIDSSCKLTMLELGSYWSFYSMWFLSKFPEASCFMAEPDKKNLFYGKMNFELNNFKGTFLHNCIGKEENMALNITSVDEICYKNDIEFLDILHSDIQGYELEMLTGSKKMLSGDRVGYVFISTHSNELHQSCKDFLVGYNFTQVANVNLDESSSWDGILVMKSPKYKGIEKVTLEIGKQPKS